jgi:hypothetical protein
VLDCPTHMRTTLRRRGGIAAGLALVATLLVAPAHPASASVSLTSTFNASGFALGDTHSLEQVHVGTYSSISQIGSGSYRFDVTYAPGGCVDATYTGTAVLTRTNGAALRGTVTGTSSCSESPFHGGPRVEARFTVDLPHGARDLQRAHFSVDCSWQPSVATTGAPSTEGCGGDGTVTVRRRVGYTLLNDEGAIEAFGGPRWFYPLDPARPTVKVASTPARDGYWLVDRDGRVHALGDATSYGNAALSPSERLAGFAPTPAGDGYWIFTNAGRVLAFGAARFRGDLRAVALHAPIVDAAATSDGNGYWMVASDGGVFAFGSAHFFGSAGNLALVQPVVGFAPTLDGRGYWMAASDGGVFAFGRARFRGSMGGRPLHQPVTAIARYGAGYLLVARDGGIFNFGTRPFFGTSVPYEPRPIVDVETLD